MIDLIGIAILIVGFFIQPLSNETVPAQLVFWLGFYLILRWGKTRTRYPIVFKAALIGLTLHIAAVMIHNLIGKFIILSSAPHHRFGDFVFTHGDWVAYPFTRFFTIGFLFVAIDFPTYSIDLVKFIAANSIFSFLNTMVYVGGGVGVGAIRKARRIKAEG